MRGRFLVVVCLVLELTACSSTERPTQTTRDTFLQRFHERGIALRYPAEWHVTGFSETVFPARAAVASFALPEDAVEGDCGGIEAVRRLPRDGALVLLIDYGSSRREGFARRPRSVTLDASQLAEYECFGRSHLFRFRVAGHDLQAHVLLGPQASEQLAREALGVLESISRA